MDDKTREKSYKCQIILLALAWYFANDGIGSKDIVVLSCKDRLSTFPKYLAYYEYIGKELQYKAIKGQPTSIHLYNSCSMD